MAKHKAGGKITASHTSIIDAAVPVVEAAEKLSEVRKISLGIIKQVGKGQRRIKFTVITGGWKVTIHGNTTLQEVYVYTTKPKKTKLTLERVFS